MRRVEHFRQFHSDRRQIVHVEESAIINFLRRDPPERESIRLGVEQFVELVEAARIARATVDLGERFFDRALHLRRFLTTPLQTSFHDFLFARALGDFFRIGLGPPRQIFERGQNALELGVEMLRPCTRRDFPARIPARTGKCPGAIGSRWSRYSQIKAPSSKWTLNSPRSRTRPY